MKPAFQKGFRRKENIDYRLKVMRYTMNFVKSYRRHDLSGTRELPSFEVRVPEMLHEVVSVFPQMSRGRINGIASDGH